MFDPKPYLIQLPRKVKDPQTGRWSTRYDDYLEVKWRLVWFRERYPHSVITTAEVCVDLERGYARFPVWANGARGGSIRAATPRLGEHSREILVELGFDDAEIADLVRDGVLVQS